MNLSRTVSLAACLVLCASSLGQSVAAVEPAAARTAVKAGDAAPDFSVVNAKGQAIKLSDFKGKVLILDISATWCGPCQAAMPNNDRVYKKYSDQGVAFLGVTADDTREAYDGWMKKNDGKYAFTMAFDPAGKENWKTSVFNTGYGVSGFPTMYVIGRDGKIQELISGGGAGEDYRLEYALARAGVKVDLKSIPPEPAKDPNAPKSIPAMTKTMAMPAGAAKAAQPAASKPAEAASPADALLGKAPPAIKVAKWVKGEPFKEFEKGKVYVVDFWATWCGPCKAAIPHLTKLAQANKGKVEVIGISIMEKQKDTSDTAYMETVEKFVTKMDDRMDYRVAMDTPDKQMYTTWFKPSGTGGIPTAWIIDQKGQVAWIGIGSPETVERIVGEVLAGTFDIKKEKELQRAAEEEARKRSEADIAKAKAQGKNGNDVFAKFPGYKEAMDRGDQAAALESLNAAFKADPTLETSAAYQWKFMILMQRGKPDEVNQYVRELLAKYPTNEDIMGFASACIVSTDDEPRFDKQLAFETAKKAADLAKPDSRWAQYTKWRLGWAYYHTGNREKAIETMQSALDGVKKLKDKFDFNDLDSQCEDALKVFNKPAK
ncbi:MAG: redoxin domain-containing protein [Planctomycetes bacterium]|nr:redoxin domain-containing protein [Planctomycetota bacterium]